jgi:hypothetical protein
LAVAYAVLLGSPNMPVDVVHHDAAVALLRHARPRRRVRVEATADVHREVLASCSASSSGSRPSA